MKAHPEMGGVVSHPLLDSIVQTTPAVSGMVFVVGASTPTVALAGVDEALAMASGSGGESAPLVVVRTVAFGEKVADLVEEGKALTYQTGNEHALVKLADGTRAIVSGGQKGISWKVGQVRYVWGHTHPYQFGATGPSADDFTMLQRLGQPSSTLVEHGQIIKFYAKE